MLLSRQFVQRILGVLWLIDGLLQLQPQMFTMNMINGVMKPMLQGQPGFVETSLQWIVQVTTQNLVLINLLIAVVQIVLGLAFLFLSGRWLRITILVSIIWSLVVWYGGEGMNMLLTGQSSVLTGSPGAVLLYAILGLVVYPRTVSSNGSVFDAQEGIISRRSLLWILAGFWGFAALLQLQSYWWQSGQISQAIDAVVGLGGLNGVIVDPALQSLSRATASLEIPLNIGLIVLFLLLGAALALGATGRQTVVRPALIASIVVSVVIWYLTQAFGGIFTGMATDFNSGLLLVVLALGCWPRVASLRKAQEPVDQTVPSASSVQSA